MLMLWVDIPGCYSDCMSYARSVARPITHSRESLGLIVPFDSDYNGEYIPSEVYMERAILEGTRAVSLGQHPVGAVVTTVEIVEDIMTRKKIMCEFGLTAAGNNADFYSGGHAETISIWNAERLVGGKDHLGELHGVLYTTHEPCPMCAGAIANSKLAGVVIGTGVDDARELARRGVRWRNNSVSGIDIIRGVEQKGRPPKFIIEGFMREECRALLELARSLK